MYLSPLYPVQTVPTARTAPTDSRSVQRQPYYSRSRSVQRHPYYSRQASNLIGRQVRVNRGGPDSVEGVLVAVPGDFLVVSAQDGIVYVNGSHVKSITEGGHGSGGNQSGKGGSDGNRSRKNRSTSFISASSFQSLLTRMRHKHVQINRGGPEKLDGFLAEIGSDNVLLVVERELVRIPTFHIKTVSISIKDKNKSNNNNGSSGSNKNQSGGNKSRSGSSGRNRSGKNSSGRNRSKSGRTGRSDGKRSGSGRTGRGSSGHSGR